MIRWFYLWLGNSLWPSLNHVLLLIGREAIGRAAPPNAGVIDTQTVMMTESDRPYGHDAGKKIKGRKRLILTDGGYAGDKLRQALRKLQKWTVEIIKRSGHAKGFEVFPRLSPIERTFAWLGRNRRLAKDFGQTITSTTARLFTASIQLLARRIARA